MKITKVLSTIMSAVICTSCFTYTANSLNSEQENKQTKNISLRYAWSNWPESTGNTFYELNVSENIVLIDDYTVEYELVSNESINIYNEYKKFIYDNPIEYESYGPSGSPNVMLIDVPADLSFNISGIPTITKLCSIYTPYNYYPTTSDKYKNKIVITNFSNTDFKIEEGDTLLKFKIQCICKVYNDIKKELVEVPINFNSTYSISGYLINEISNSKCCYFDSDTDGMLTVNDAQMILNYYVEYMSGNVSGKVEDYQKFIENFKETS